MYPGDIFGSICEEYMRFILSEGKSAARFVEVLFVRYFGRRYCRAAGNAIERRFQDKAREYRPDFGEGAVVVFADPVGIDRDIWSVLRFRPARSRIAGDLDIGISWKDLKVRGFERRRSSPARFFPAAVPSCGWSYNDRLNCQIFHVRCPY